MSTSTPRILLIAPYYDKQTPGESWSTFKWAEGISALYPTTILTAHKRQWDPTRSPLNAEEIINFEDYSLPRFLGRLERELKPLYFSFYQKASTWLENAANSRPKYDLIHQINPLALRYPSPAIHYPAPFIIGPLAGSLPTPYGFRKENVDRTWYRHLRRFDSLRHRHDPWLRRTYESAATIIGAAPYVREILSAIPIQRFEVMSETGVELIPGTPRTYDNNRPLRLLYVGRIIRTKGVIDAIRAIAIANKKADVRLDIIGTGDMLDECKREATNLHLQSKVTFHGQLPKDALTSFYKESHVFLFPSFREPSGNVVFEALSYGLPVITTTIGGPASTVTDACGFRITPTVPETFAEDLSKAILVLKADPQMLTSKSRGALQRMRDIALWEGKIMQISHLYESILTQTSSLYTFPHRQHGTITQR